MFHHALMEKMKIHIFKISFSPSKNTFVVHCKNFLLFFSFLFQISTNKFFIGIRILWFNSRYDQDFSRDPQLIDECFIFINEIIAKEDPVQAEHLSKLLNTCVQFLFFFFFFFFFFLFFFFFFFFFFFLFSFFFFLFSSFGSIK